MFSFDIVTFVGDRFFKVGQRLRPFYMGGIVCAALSFFCEMNMKCYRRFCDTIAECTYGGEHSICACSETNPIETENPVTER